MQINTQEISKIKTMPINLFKGNKIYSFNSTLDFLEVCTLNDVNFENQFCIDNKSFDLIKKFNNPDLEFKDNILIVKEGKKKFTTKTFEYKLPDFNLTNMVKCEIDLESLKTARKFTSSKDARPILTSVHLKDNGNIYATDSFVLYRNVIADTINDDELHGINISNSFIDLLQKNNDEKIEISFNDYCVLVKQENMMYVGRLILGMYPKLSKIFTDFYHEEIEYNLKELKENINFANNVGATKENNGNIICRLKNNQMQCFGDCDYECEFDYIKYSNDFDLTFTIDKLSLLINTFKNDENINLKFKNSTSPLYCHNDFQDIVITPIRKQYDD